EALCRPLAAPALAEAGLPEDGCSSGLLAPARDANGAIVWAHSWAVGSRILTSGGSRVVSPEFQLGLPGQEPTRFALMLTTHRESLGTVGRGRHSFKKSRGRGLAMIKCKGGPLAASTFGIALWLEDGGEAPWHPPAVQHSFAERSAYQHEPWQLCSGDSDRAELTVALRLTLAARAAEAPRPALAATAPAPASSALAPAAPSAPAGLGGAAALGAPEARTSQARPLHVLAGEGQQEW
ncbi:unnamed protein product, partial [Prorocentrum cordatum]